MLTEWMSLAMSNPSDKDPQPVTPPSAITRRTFTRHCLLGAAGAALGGAFEKSSAAEPCPPAPAQPGAAPAKKSNTLPQGKIGDISLSRLILGCNLFGGGHHHTMLWARDLAREYNTESKIIETLEGAEDHGIDTIMLHHDREIVSVLEKHRKNGGKMQWIVAPLTKMNESAAYAEEVREMADKGVAAAYVFGVHADAYVKEGHPELIARALEIIKMNALPSGVACHDLNVVKACEKLNAGAEYYIKTLHHHRYLTAPKPGEPGSPGSDTDIAEHDNGWCRNPDETIAYMNTLDKPWVAFKVMAAGMIQPKDGFRYAYESGADFILAGILDFQLEEDAKLVNAILADLPKRTRPWRA